jgi:RecA-family ATPase
VLYVSLDPGANRKKVKPRLLEICKRMGANPQGNLRLVDTHLSLNEPASVASFLQKNPGEFALVVIDSLYKAVTPGSDLSQAGIMTPATDGMQEIADATGAAVVVVHHEGRGNLGHPYGSMFLEAALSSLVHVVRNEATGKVTAKVEAMKNGEARAAPFVYRLEGPYLESVNAPRDRKSATAPAVAGDVPHRDMLALIPTTATLIRDARKLIEHLLSGSDDARRKQWERIRADWVAAGLVIQKGGMIRRVA